jgi:hypothetical protein
MRALPRLHSVLVVPVVFSTLFAVWPAPAAGQGTGRPGGPQVGFMPPPGPGMFSLGLQTRVTDTGMLVVGHSFNSVGRAVGVERGDTVITLDGLQVGQVANRLVDLDQTLDYIMNRQESAVMLLRNGRDGRLLNVTLRRNQFGMSQPGGFNPGMPFPGASNPGMPAPGSSNPGMPFPGASNPGNSNPLMPAPGGAMRGQITQVKKWYLEYLGRDATPQEVGGMETQLRQGRQVDQLRNELLASPEYYRRNGNDESKFIGALFRDLLRRNPVAPEGGNWLTRLKQLKNDRGRFIEAFRTHYRV